MLGRDREGEPDKGRKFIAVCYSLYTSLPPVSMYIVTVDARLPGRVTFRTDIVISNSGWISGTPEVSFR